MAIKYELLVGGKNLNDLVDRTLEDLKSKEPGLGKLVISENNAKKAIFKALSDIKKLIE